ncbi:hypothetical protein GFS60_06377 (plasmid) [Rhodococcus sp. WAY2]|nr:hypothetical protein GFS60_06377 [Rhodococcus sp. WAY2]
MVHRNEEALPSALVLWIAAFNLQIATRRGTAVGWNCAAVIPDL